MRQYRRSDRVAEEILRTISRIWDSDFAGGINGLVTFTHVRLSSDLCYATVYYSFLGQQEDRETAAEYIFRNKKRIRYLVGANLHIRHIPELTFKYDPSTEEGVRIERLLNEIRSKTEE